jgi:hypothetical protein
MEQNSEFTTYEYVPDWEPTEITVKGYGEQG